MIRRKSASERLAESRSKYIRSDLYTNDTLNIDLCLKANGQTIDGDSDFWGTQLDEQENLKPNFTMRQYHATPTSTKSSHTSCSRQSPFSDHVSNSVHGEEKCLNGTHLHHNLVDRINCQLKHSKQQCNGLNSSYKKRVSPKHSDGSLSTGMSNLEIQLRELITLDANSESQIQVSPITNVIPLQEEATGLLKNVVESTEHHQMITTTTTTTTASDLQREKELHNIYRAELKFIGSSSSSSGSLSSMYSESNNSMSQVESCNVMAISEMLPVTPSAREQQKYQAISKVIVRSKSDVSQSKRLPDRYFNDPYKVRHVERLFGSLGLDSDSYHHNADQIYVEKNRKSSQSSNLLNYTASSISNDSLHKIIPARPDSVDNTCRKVSKVHSDLYGTKSSSTNDLSSINSSETDHLYKNVLNHSKSTSKLTFENLMLHQQNLATSRSCHNLVANLQNGPSVVERNARIIKWLFNCRKAMNQIKPVNAFS